MYGYKEKNIHYQDLQSPEHAQADYALLKKVAPTHTSVMLGAKNPARHFLAILFALLDFQTREEIVSNRREVSGEAAAERAEAERLTAEQAEAERIAFEQAEAERLAAEKVATESADPEKPEADLTEKEQELTEKEDELNEKEVELEDKEIELQEKESELEQQAADLKKKATPSKLKATSPSKGKKSTQQSAGPKRSTAKSK